MNARIHRRGFVMLMAIGLLAIVGVALAVMTAMLSHESRRTSAGGDDAQLRQVLVAAQAWLAARPEDARLDAASVPLPPPLAGLGASAEVRVAPAANDERTAVITARLPDRQLQQTLRYRRDGVKWRAVAAELSR